jgi:heterodisulfide reductase subunit B
MAKKEYAFYPGCSSQLRGSAANYLVSVESMCEKLDVKMTQIPDWNCCGASISYAGSSELARHVLSARNFALSDKHLPGQDVVATCAACWLGGRETIEKLDASSELLADTNEALMVEVLVEDLGYEELGKPVVKPLDGVKVAGYVGCQTNRPFGIAGESFENPMYLDKLIDTVGGESIAKYEEKVSCCGGSLAFCEPEKAEKQIKMIVESAYDHGADVICTPCPLCQANVEVYQSEINRKQGTKLDMPVVYYSQLLSVAYGGTLKEAGLDGHIIQPKKLQEIAVKVVPAKR